MKNLCRPIALALTTCALFLPAQSTVAVPIIWNEIGDAGGLGNPQFLTGGPYNTISGNLAAILSPTQIDDEDVFAFQWGAAGAFSAKYTGDDPTQVQDITIALYDYSGHVAGSAPIAGLDFQFAATGISTANLPAGDYLLALHFLADPGADPPYTIGISGPTDTPLGDANIVPETASTFALISAGLLSLFAVRSVARFLEQKYARESVTRP